MGSILPSQLAGLRSRVYHATSRPTSSTPSRCRVWPTPSRAGTVRHNFKHLEKHSRIVRSARTYATSSPKPNGRLTLDTEEWSLLRGLLSNPTDGGFPSVSESATAATDTASAYSQSSRPTEHLKVDAGPAGARPAAPDLGLAESLKHPLNKLAYFIQLSQAARKARELGSMSTTVVAQLPTTAFSELLRSLDPIDSFSKEFDPTDGMYVGPGMAQLTSIGQEIDVWGVRKRYVNLLAQAMNAAQLRIEAGRPLLLSDCKILLRCAGAASDLDAMKTIWDMMAATGRRELDPEAYRELAQARFLTEPLYTQYDMARFRVRPINLHMKKIWILGRKQRNYLRILAHNLYKRQRHAFGYNRRSLGHAEHLTRLMRQDKPPFLLYKAATKLCYVVDERLLCASMVALARSGSMRLFEDLVLKKYWGVEITRRTGCEAHVAVQAIAYAPDSPLRPSGRLLEAIVSSYCINAEFALGLKVLDAISRCYAIPISDKVWSDLLEWAYILSSKPVVTEWKVLGRQFRGTKGVGRNAVQMVWDTMTAEPYNVQPGLRQYQLLINDLISQGNVEKTLDFMLELEPMYRSLLCELEGAFCKHALSAALGVGVARSEMTWRRARARKHAALYRLQLMCRGLLKKVGTGKAGGHTTIRGVPQFIEAFRDLLPANIKYAIRTGKVQIDHAPPVRRLQRATVKFTQLPATTGEFRIAPSPKKLKPKVIEEKRLGPAPHVSLHGFLTQKPSWPLIQREFH